MSLTTEQRAVLTADELKVYQGHLLSSSGYGLIITRSIRDRGQSAHPPTP